LTSGRTKTENLAKPITIGGVVVDPPLILGPMAGTTNRVHRLLCRRGGAGLVCSEMVSINAIVQGNERTHEMLAIFEDERPVSIQVFGSDPEIMRDAVPHVVEAGADIIDINMGCSVRKIRKNGAGVALMGEPDLAAELTAAAVEASEVPVTVKIRAGLTMHDRSYVDYARRMQDVGAAAVAVHWRAASQAFGGTPGWQPIADVARALDVPVIGNGDVTQPEEAPMLMRHTGCDAVMIARAAWGCPWIFARAAAALRGERVPPDLGVEALMATALLHAQMLALDYGERLAIHQMRSHIHHYVKGLPRARHFRREANQLETLEQLRALVMGYMEGLRAHRARVEARDGD
jgi:tRNA-dihydrouridine synthase B